MTTQEEILNYFISEPGIVKIIIEYKKQLEKIKKKKKKNNKNNNNNKKRCERKLLRLHKINFKINMRN